MYRILESKLKIKFKDNKINKASITRTARTTTLNFFQSL